ncbi:MAG: energy transducer TonB [Bacteroidota bacterium]
MRNTTGESETVKQPLPLPEGVSNQALPKAAGNFNRRVKTKKMSNSYNQPSSHGETSKLGSLDLAQDAEEVNIDALPLEEEKEEDAVFMRVEKAAVFAGGNKALKKYLKDNLQYPAKAKAAGVKGKVFISFVVNPDGSISDIKIIKGLGYGCDEEAIRLMKNSPRWQPAVQGGKIVKSRMQLAIDFQL